MVAGTIAGALIAGGISQALQANAPGPDLRVAGPEFLAEQATGIQRASAGQALKGQEELFPEAFEARQNLFDQFLKISRALRAPGEGFVPGEESPIARGALDTIRALATQTGGPGGATGLGSNIAQGLGFQTFLENQRRALQTESLQFQREIGQPVPQIQTIGAPQALGVAQQQAQLATTGRLGTPTSTTPLSSLFGSFAGAAAGGAAAKLVA